MNQDIFREFQDSSDSLRVYREDRLVFASAKDRLLPLLEYLEAGLAGRHRPVTVCDKVIGNSAALLAIEAGAREVASPLGSRLAAETLERYGIAYSFSETVPYIQQAANQLMCPMEKLSLGRTPEEFYRAMRRIRAGQ